ncbi:hypothetical protein F5Y01DRAFT_329298 [Xylaria sp. FL0043]|nr:hypothetical protein F5Y01DRAFT_329298 [Xylaria sp. FL0043]
MQTPFIPDHPKRKETWATDTTYHSLYAEDDDKKTLINATVVEDLGSASEQPKVALSKRLSWLHPLVHLLPVLVTLSIVQLSVRGVYWDDDSRYDTRWQTVLQFPAKLHEILIVGSLSAMVLHIFRRMLVSPNGIPLGLMVGAFQMGSAEYLISKSYVKPFWHSLTNSRQQMKTFFVALALGIAILYSFLVGPASAGALIPDLAWWNMHHPFNNSLKLPSYISRDASELYPMALKGSDITDGCLGDYREYVGCPAEGFSVLDSWAWERVQEGYWYNISESQHYNPTMLSSFSGQAQREIVVELVASENSTTASAISATLHSTVLALTDAFWHYVNSNVVGKINKADRVKFTMSGNNQALIPLVQVQCQAYDFGNSRIGHSPLMFDTTAMIDDFSEYGFNAYSSKHWIVPDDAWNYTRPQPWNNTNITWIDTSRVKGAEGWVLPSSLAAVVTVPVLYTYNLANGTNIDQQGSITSPCIIDARWATTDVTFDTSENVVRTSLTDWLNSANLLTGKVDLKAKLSKWKISDPISISPDWADKLNSPQAGMVATSDTQSSFFVETILQEFVSAETTDDGTEIQGFVPSAANGQWPLKDAANDIAVVLSTIMADWIARSTFAGTNLTTVISAENNNKKDGGNVSTVDLLSQRTAQTFGTSPMTAFDDQTRVVFTVQRYGWGYGLRTETIWFSVIILLIHVVLVVVYTGYSFAFWVREKGWNSNAWGTIGELLALAVLSPPAEELKNTGAGIRNSKTWMTTLRVREAKADAAQLELVVGTRGGTVIPRENRVRIDRAYS